MSFSRKLTFIPKTHFKKLILFELIIFLKDYEAEFSFDAAEKTRREQANGGKLLEI
jgi:hypothetical protein